MKFRLTTILLAWAIGASVGARAQERTPDDDAIRALITTIEQAVRAGDGAAYLALHVNTTGRTGTRDFIESELTPGATRAALQERDRQPLTGTLPGNGYRLMVDAFSEFGSRARVSTWRLDIMRTAAPGTREWTIVDEERLSSVENLYRLGINPSRQFTARNLTVSAEDIDLTLVEGSVFVAEIDQGATALVLMGTGTFSFHPTPDTEKGQVKIFCGAELLESKFEAAYLRLNPGDVQSTIQSSQLTAVPVDPRLLRRAQDIFRDESQKSFVIDLGDLSREPWSLLPGAGDFVAEIRTRRYDTLTYAKAGNEAEDISFFDRKRHHNISLYPSKQKLLTRGRFYNEDDLVDYDILDYDVEVAANPARMWIDGRARLHIKVRAYALGTLSLKIADSLTVGSIVSYEYGRLFGIRVKNQNSLVVNLPTTLTRDAQLTLMITYSGRLTPQTPDRETIAVAQARESQDDMSMLAAEPSFLYSSRSYWYPQAPVSDYATARIQITVPSGIECVASGELEPGFPGLLVGKEPGQNQKVYVFSAAQPIRYLAFILSRFTRAETATIAFGAAKPETAVDGVPLTGIAHRSLNLSVEANPRQVQRGRELSDRAADIAMFYESIVGDSPYSSFTVAVVESDLPGGHSPGYFAALNQPLPTSQLVWRNDPAAFAGFPDFFLAHEVAHQWWGQAVGWRNYHEQWLSEGFAQYFAALYAQHQRGDDLFESVLRQLRRFGMDESKQGPIYLGYRLGHIRGQSRIFRALIYNKGAAVLHMLRRMVGDDAFFRGIRRYYRTSRFQKAGTEDLRKAMETESGQSLERFFERWIYGATLPKLKLAYRVEGNDVIISIEQLGEIFDVPVTVRLQYADRKPVDVVVAVTDRTAEKRVTLAGVLRSVDFSKDDGTLADVVK